MPKFIKFIHYLNLIAAIGIIIFIPKGIIFLRPFLVLFFSTYLIEFFIDKKWQQFKWNYTQIFPLSALILFSLMFLYYPFESTHVFFDKLLGYRLPLLGFGIVGLFGLNKEYRLRYFAFALIAAAIGYIVYVFAFLEWNTFIESDRKIFLFCDMRNKLVTHHMMFNFYTNCAIICALYLLLGRWEQNRWWRRLLLCFVIILLYGVSFLSEGRSGFFAANIILFLNLCFYRRPNFVISISVALAVVLLFVFSAGHHPRMHRDFVEKEPRYILWQEAVLVIKESPVIGHGCSDGEVLFAEKMQKAEDYKGVFSEVFRANQMLDSHNQFLQIMIEFGLLGLLLVFCIYLSPIFTVPAKRSFITLNFVFLSVWQSCFDMFLTGQFSLIFMLFIVLFLRVPPSSTQIEIKS